MKVEYWNPSQTKKFTMLYKDVQLVGKSYRLEFKSLRAFSETLSNGNITELGLY